MSFNKEGKIQKAKEILGYSFGDDDRVWEALSPPGAYGTRTEGNQGLAGIGPSVIQTVFRTQSYLDNDSPGAAADKASKATSVQALVNVFHNSGLNDCLNPNPSQTGQAAPKTAVSVIYALLGLISLEEGGRLAQVANAMQKLDIIESAAIVKFEHPTGREP